MINKISNFRIYAALDYTAIQIYSMSDLFPTFPRHETIQLAELTKNPVNRNWEFTTNLNISDNSRIKISNIIKSNQFTVGIYRLMEKSIKND